MNLNKIEANAQQDYQDTVRLTNRGAYANLPPMNSMARHFRRWRSPSARLTLAISSIVLLILSGMACGSGPADTSATGQVRDAVYDFPIVFYQGQDAVGGENLELSDLRGQPIVLNFWAGLCPPCRAEMPEFQHLADDYAGRALVVGVDLGQFFSLGSQEDAMKLLNDLEVKYPAGYTGDANVVRELGVLGLPATFFINADGSLHRKWQGVLNTEKLTEITDEMLAQ